jgi:hypothetical protein
MLRLGLGPGCLPKSEVTTIRRLIDDGSSPASVPALFKTAIQKVDMSILRGIGVARGLL